jgi:hypothetical protein
MGSALHDDIVLAKLLRQDHVIVVVGASAIALLAWAYLFYQGWAMQHMDLVAMAMPSTCAWGPVDLLLVFAMWAVMMVAMMVPSPTEERYRFEPVEFLTVKALIAFLDPINSKAPHSYEEVPNRFEVSTGGVKTLIPRLRKRYTVLLREEVGCTVSDPAEIDEEIHALFEALIASEGRVGP